jgi:hypothetical protein
LINCSNVRGSAPTIKRQLTPQLSCGRVNKANAQHSQSLNRPTAAAFVSQQAHESQRMDPCHE